MFEDMIMQLDEMGVAYTEDYDTGTLTIDVSGLDKVALIGVIQMVNGSGMEYTIDEASLVIMSGKPPVAEEEEEEAPMDPMEAAFNDFQF